MSKCACLICPFRSTVSLLLLILTISDSAIFSESDEYGASSAPLPHRPVSIPSLSHSACPRRKLSKSALIVWVRLLGHRFLGHHPTADFSGPAKRLSVQHSHFVGSHVAFFSVRAWTCTCTYQSRRLLWMSDSGVSSTSLEYPCVTPGCFWFSPLAPQVVWHFMFSCGLNSAGKTSRLDQSTRSKYFCRAVLSPSEIPIVWGKQWRSHPVPTRRSHPVPARVYRLVASAE
jgi:hypothetical protein